MSGCPFKHLWPGSAVAPHPSRPQEADLPAVAAVASSRPAACPVSGHASGVSADNTSAAFAEAAAASAAAAAPAGGLEPPAPGAEQQGDAAGKCPFLSGVGGVALGGGEAEASGAPASNNTADAAGSSLGAEQQPAAVCPLGFGGGQQPKLGEFHCLICRSLYHDCVNTSCGHRYCRGCIRRFQDCPICGADVAGLEADAEKQALVDRYIEAHAGNHTIWELEGSGGQKVDGMAGERSRAAFLLQLGLRAMAAGNTDSARQRFLLCQHELQQQLQAAQQQQDQQQQPGLASLQCRLGAVCGCLGDCCRADGDAAGCLAHYQQSVGLLQAAGEDPEAQQALSVALNKVGELHHLQGDLASAAEQYSQALQLRRSLLAATQRQCQQGGEEQAQQGAATASSGGGKAQPGSEAAGAATGGGEQAALSGAIAAAAARAAEGSEACCSALLDLAASCLKLSGARGGLGEAEAAEALLSEAEGLLAALQLDQQPERLRRKHDSLAQFVGMMRQQHG